MIRFNNIQIISDVGKSSIRAVLGTDTGMWYPDKAMRSEEEGTEIRSCRHLAVPVQRKLWE